MKKNIVFLVGKGKTTLTNFFVKEDSFSFNTCYQIIGGQLAKTELRQLVNPGLNVCEGFDEKSLVKAEPIIKEAVAENVRFLIHCQEDFNMKDLPAGIRRRSMKFKLDY